MHAFFARPTAREIRSQENVVMSSKDFSLMIASTKLAWSVSCHLAALTIFEEKDFDDGVDIVDTVAVVDDDDPTTNEDCLIDDDEDDDEVIFGNDREA